ELYFTPRRHRCLALSDESVAIARRSGDTRALVDALSVRRLLAGGPAALAERLTMSDEVVVVAERAGDVTSALRGRVARVVDLVEAGRVDTIDAEIDAVARLADEIRQPAWSWYPAKWRAMRAIMAGRVDEGERLAGEALAIGRRPHGRTAAQAHIVQLAEIRRCQGRLGELEAHMAGGARQYRAVAAWRCGLAWLHAEVGRDADARHGLDELAADGFAALPDDFTRVTCMAMLAEVAVTVDDAERAAALFELLSPYANQCMFAGQAELYGGWVTRYLGLLATTLRRWPEAERFLLDARRSSDQMGARPDVARTEAGLAALYSARAASGDRERSEAAAQRCIAEAEYLRLPALARDVLTR
ncbi:MAG: hypothetical protein ABIW46_07785, partial [Acidimicrobiales bacterium]